MAAIEDAEPDKPGFIQDDLNALYANNIHLKPSVWDLKLVFGEVDQKDGQMVVDQHTSMTIPWTQAKLLVYYLQITIYGQELEHGPISFPEVLLPPEPDQSSFHELPGSQAFFEYIKKLRAEFVAANRPKARG